MSYFIIILGVLFLGVLNILMKQNDHQLAIKQKQRYQSYLLADQLRQSSDELTRLARTYVVTGDSQYEKMYWDILAIRNGKKARPQHYHRIYWDLILIYGDKPRLDGDSRALQDLMKDAGFTKEEFAKLDEAQKNSDGLVTTETIALNAVKGLYNDGTGNYVKKGEPDLEMAIRIMHDAQYHKNKAAIMKPIDEFFKLLDERTKVEVQHYANKADFLLWVIQIVIFLLATLSIVIGIFVTARILKQVGGEPAKIAYITKEVARGNLNIEFNSFGKANTGIYADVQAMVKNFKMVIEDIVHVSHGLANGNLHILPQATYEGDLVEIKKSLEIALLNQRQVIEDIIQVSNSLAVGDLNVTTKVEYKGDFVPVKTSLENTLLDLQKVIQDIVQVSQGLAEGQLVTAKAEYKGEFLQIKNTLETAAAKLAEATEQNAIQDWLKTGQTKLNQIISGEQDVITLAQNVINFMIPYLEAQVGVLYLVDGEIEKGDINDNIKIKLLASYAYNQRKGLANEFRFGEGLVGQAAMEKQKILVTDVPEDYISIQSGLGESVPKNILVMPFMYENTVKGVIEIGTFHKMTDVQLEFIEQVIPNIGIAVNTAESRTKMQKMLLQQESTTRDK